MLVSTGFVLRNAKEVSARYDKLYNTTNLPFHHLFEKSLTFFYPMLGHKILQQHSVWLYELLPVFVVATFAVGLLDVPVRYMNRLEGARDIEVEERGVDVTRTNKDDKRVE